MTGLALAVVALRGVNLAATLSTLGTATFAVAIAPEAGKPARRLLWIGVGVAWVSGALWLAVQAADMADAGSVAEALRAMPVALIGTRFGHTLMLRLVLLLAAAITFGEGRWRAGLALLFAACAGAAQAWFGHAAAAEEITLPSSVILHVLAAGAWLGGLLPLWLMVGDAPIAAAAAAARRFSLLGMAAVTVLAGTALVQGRVLIGGIAGLLGTTYGNLALVKLTLFVLLVALAGINRGLLVKRLAAGRDRARRQLRVNIALEMALGLAVVLTAARLAEQFPASHEQPDWPFGWRLDPTLLADPATWRALAPAAIGGGAAVALGVAGMLVRRIRWLALGSAGALAAVAAFHLGSLFVPAYPTTFHTSLTDFSASSIAHGAALFAEHCTPCHGAEGRGDGPVASSLPVPPLDLTALHLWAHPDGDLYWWISHGYEDATGGGLAMPGFADAMSDDERWNVIDFLHAHAAGAQMAASGQWPVAVPAPEIDVACARGEMSLSDLRGRVVRIASADAPPGAPAGVATVVLARLPTAPERDACVARDPDAWLAYAIIAGVPADALPGAEFLIDPQGWVRKLWISGEGPASPTQTELDAAVKDVIQHPVKQNMPGHHHP